MAKPIKWSRDLHPIRDKACRSRTETWSRTDVQHLFGIGRVSAQGLMKLIGGIQVVGGVHFVDRGSLLEFLDEMIAASSVEAGMQARLLEADAPPKPKPLRIALPPDLRNVMLRDLPEHIRLQQGRLEIDAPDTVAMLEALALLAQALQNDLDSAYPIWDPAPAQRPEEDFDRFLSGLRDKQMLTI